MAAPQAGTSCCARCSACEKISQVYVNCSSAVVKTPSSHVEVGRAEARGVCPGRGPRGSSSTGGHESLTLCVSQTYQEGEYGARLFRERGVETNMSSTYYTCLHVTPSRPSMISLLSSMNQAGDWLVRVGIRSHSNSRVGVAKAA